MATDPEPYRVIEISDDSSDGQREWMPRRPTFDPLPIAQRDLHTRGDTSRAARSVPVAPSPTLDLDSDLDGDFIDPAFLNMGNTVGTPLGPQMDVDVFQGYEACLQEVLEVFPDISRDHVQQLYDAQMPVPMDGQTIPQHLISQILDKGKYPKEKDRLKELKRKRFVDSDEEEVAYLKNLERSGFDSQYTYAAKLMLQEEFPDIPQRYIDLRFRETSQFFATYQALDLARRTWEDPEKRPYAKLKRPRTQRYLTQNEDFAILENMLPAGYGIEYVFPGSRTELVLLFAAYQICGNADFEIINRELKREIMAARKLRKKEDAKQQSKRDMSTAEAAKEKEYRDRGEVLECDTCCDDLPTYKFTYCDGDNPHFVCFGCLQRYADTEIGNQRYELGCLDDSGCKATYSRKERQRALDAKTVETLERLQQQAELKLANVAGLENCPFCHFAAICPPVKIDKEFQCRNPDCERISCRLCNKDSHIPMSCKEYKKSFGVDERHAVEEAMTKALLKTCPKCGKQILKQDGCNKVICFCGGMMCDYCGKDITTDGYNHFGGPGGSSKKCPTHDNFEERRQGQVKQAQAEAIRKARQENPDLTEEQLKLKFSKDVENENAMGHGYGGPRLPPVMAGWPRMPNLDNVPQHVRAHLQNHLGIPMDLARPAVPGQMPAAHQPILNPYQPMPPGHQALPQQWFYPQPPMGAVPIGGFGNVGFPNPPPPPQPQNGNLLERRHQRSRAESIMERVNQRLGRGAQENVAPSLPDRRHQLNPEELLRGVGVPDHGPARRHRAPASDQAVLNVALDQRRNRVDHDLRHENDWLNGDHDPARGHRAPAFDHDHAMRDAIRERQGAPHRPRAESGVERRQRERR